MVRVVTVAVALVVLLSGCGGTSDNDKIKAVIHDYTQAIVDKDFSKACAKLTATAKRTLVKAGSTLGGGDCKKILASALDSLPAATKAKLKGLDFKVKQIKVTGNTATATLSESLDGNSTKTHLRKQGGTWLVDQN